MSSDNRGFATLKNLNPEQKRAVEADHRPLLIVAGAGTGKTRTLTSRIIHFIESGIPGGSICAITFTNKAAKEMASRIPPPKRGGGGGGPFIGTFHSLGARILRSEARRLGRGENYVIFDDHDSSQLIKKIAKEEVGKKSDMGPALFIRRISAIKSGKVSLEELRISNDQRDRVAAGIFERYEAVLTRQNAFDFDDLIEKVVVLFKTNPDVLERYRRAYTHLLVDEYQDLNNVQYEFIKLLSGPSGHVSVVGDDQQLIYGWRYANADIFLNFENDWPEAQTVVLEENYRSTGNIIRAASELVTHNKKQKPKTLWTKNDDGSPIEIIEAMNEDGEATLIAERIARLKPTTSHLSPESTAVLYRTNAQSRAIEQALLERGIPYRIFGGIKFYERREVKDVLAALRLALNPRDEVSRERLLKTFSKKIFSALEELLRAADGTRPLALVNTFLKVADYGAYLEKQFVNAAERAENIAELAHFASQFEDLATFIEQVSLLQSTDALRDEDKEGRVVNLMTIHLAKGLEFDCVFVIGCSEGLLPHARALETEAELEEERRLMYVAMTRARRHLHISFYDIPSRFLFEIPPELTEFKSAASEETQLVDDEERYITLD